MALVHHWALGEASGTRVDSIGSRDLTVSGTDTVSAATGLIGGALDCNVSFGILSSGTTRALDIDGANDFSVSGAVYFTNAPGSLERVVLYANATETFLTLDRLVGGEFEATVMNTNSDVYTVTGSTVTAATTWYFWNLTFSRDGSFKLFVNAVEENSVVTGDFAWHSSTQSPRFLLGSSQSDISPMVGRIDEVSVDDEALSSGEITTLYNAGALTNRVTSYVANFTSGLVGYWKLEEASGDRTATVGGIDLPITSDAGNAPGVLGNGMVTNSAAYARGIGTSPLNGVDQATVNVWAKWDDAAGSFEPLFREQVQVGAGTLFSVNRAVSGLVESQFFDSNGGDQLSQSLAAPSTGVFHLITLVYRRNGVQRLYVDANELASNENLVDDFPLADISPDHFIVIGANAKGTGQMGNGVIDEASYYTRALTTGDIKAYYNSGSPDDLTPVGGAGRPRFSNGFFRSSS